jgi:hypothetical protein
MINSGLRNAISPIWILYISKEFILFTLTHVRERVITIFLYIFEIFTNTIIVISASFSSEFGFSNRGGAET